MSSSVAEKLRTLAARPFCFFIIFYIKVREPAARKISNRGRARNRPLAPHAGPCHGSRVRVAVTTSRHAGPREEAAAREAASRHGLPSVARRGRSLDTVAGACGAEALLVLGARRAALFIDGAERPWSPGMGELRLKRLRSGERTTRDAFLDAA